MNWVKKNIERLQVNNYVRKADSNTNYWVDFSFNKLQRYKKKTNNKFYIIIYGNGEIESDFYIIPFSELEHILSIQNVTKSKDRNRWIGNIINHKITFGKQSERVNISQYYSVPLLNKTLLISTSNIENDYAIENAKREVHVRINQSLFRRQVLNNFQNECCLTGVSETALLRASHIIPWASKIDTRLSPHNGLCLSILYDQLFDKGYFTLNNDLIVIITDTVNSLSDYIKNALLTISEKHITPPITYCIDEESLNFHRDNIFDKFN